MELGIGREEHGGGGAGTCSLVLDICLAITFPLLDGVRSTKVRRDGGLYEFRNFEGVAVGIAI